MGMDTLSLLFLVLGGLAPLLVLYVISWRQESQERHDRREDSIRHN